MINLLTKVFIKNSDNVKNEKVRLAYGVMMGVIGILVNVILSVFKLLVGSLTNSISITADAVNNLSDAASSGISLIGFKIASKPADPEHPFGHGRIEYISSVIVSFLILLMGFEVLKDSVDKIINPQKVEFSYVAVIVLAVSILSKLWLAYANNKVGKKIGSLSMSAVVKDSISDSIVTAVALVSLVLSKFVSFPVDGITGIIVSVFVFIAGINALKETLGPLLGQPPEKELVEQIKEEVLSYDEVVGIHDLIIHDYGPSRLFGSVHVEVPCDVDLMSTHDTIDLIERKIMEKYKMLLVIHLDPLDINNEHINRLYGLTKKIVKEIDPQLNLHDFRAVDGPTHTNFIFDLVVPFEYPIKNSALIKMIESKLSEVDESYFVVINIEHDYSN